MPGTVTDRPADGESAARETDADSTSRDAADSDHAPDRDADTRDADPAEVREDLLALSALLGRKWHLVVLDRLLREPAGFSALERDIDGISGKVLSDSLEDLEEKGFVDRTVLSERPFRVEYSPTDAGRSLSPVVEVVRRDDLPLS